MRFILALGILVSASAFSEEVFRIEVGKNPDSYSNKELRKRVGDLERAVMQLQGRVFQLESGQLGPIRGGDSDEWLCTIEARGEKHMGTGGSKPVAAARALEACKTANKGDGFFCGQPKCEQ